MNQIIKDGLFFGLFGLVLGAIVGFLLAGAYVDFRIGVPLDQFQLLDALRVSPWGDLINERYWTHVLLICGGGGLAGMIGAIALGVRPSLDSHGSARWASLQDLQKNKLLSPAAKVAGPIYAKTSLPKGRGKFISSQDIPHSFIAAPTGSGKGVGVVIPTLLTYPGSVICLDVKGENFEKTSRQRKEMGDLIYKFAPFDEEEKTHRYNPLEDVAALPEKRRYAEAQRIAESLLYLPGNNAQGFMPSAKQILVATILVAIEHNSANLGTVYDLLSQGKREDGEGEADFAALFKQLADETGVEEAKAIYNRMAGTDYKTVSAYMSVLFDGGLGQWAEYHVRRATEASDFSISELRRRPASIFLVVGPNDLQVLSPLIRMMFQQTVSILQRSEPGEDEPYPVLLLMDEFPALGKMGSLSQGITTLRSYGGRMMVVAQSISNLKAAYGNDGAQNFLANCRLQLFMAPADAETPEYVSKSIGDFTRKSRSKSWRMNEFGGSNISEREEGARLLRPEDLRRLGDDEVVLLIQGQNAVRAKKVRYFEDRELKKLFEAQSGRLPEPPIIVAASKPRAQVFNLQSADQETPEASNVSGSRLKRLKSETDGSSDLTEKRADALLNEQNKLLNLIGSVQQENIERA
ncbi:type IV secretion system ATPase VirD4 [Roseibium sp. HPY-6]|uniref:type IV secretion system ATPase VirD4 n=1 Tax=Roseibium sp. HPY-6 TaxID=3229852 RepID=UPI00338EC63C